MIELRKLKDEKESFLYQWDLGRDVVITPKAGYHVDSVEYWNGTTELAPEGVIREEDGLIVSEIPNEFLQSENSIHVRAVMRDGDDRRIIKREILTVIPCAKPAGYIYTPTEIKTWNELDERLKKLEEGGAVGSLVFNDDGSGNITISTTSGTLRITDDGAGNVTIGV